MDYIILTLAIIIGLLIILIIGYISFRVYNLHKNNNKTKLDDDINIKNLHEKLKDIENSIKNSTEHLLSNKEKTDTVHTEVRKLNDLFLKTKDRGNIGENILNTVLEDSFGKGGYNTQYTIKNGAGKIDFIIPASRRNNKWIGIDSKFNTNYGLKSDEERNEFKQRIKQTAHDLEKYISKEIPLVLMYIPSESIYEDIIDTIGMTEINNLYKKNNVLICSPTYLLFLISLIKEGLNDEQLSQEVKDQIEKIKELKESLNSFCSAWIDHGKHIQKIANSYKTVSTKTNKMTKKMQAIGISNRTQDAQNKDNLTKINNEISNEVSYLSDEEDNAIE